MKRHLTYIMFGTTIILGYFLFAVNFYVYASDVPSIAFSSTRGGNDDIYMMDINGKNLQQLTDHSARESAPTFSPDGAADGLCFLSGWKARDLCDVPYDKSIPPVDAPSGA